MHEASSVILLFYVLFRFTETPLNLSYAANVKNIHNEASSTAIQMK